MRILIILRFQAPRLDLVRSYSMRCDYLCCAHALYNSGNRTRQNFKIEPQRPFIHILKIEPHPLLERDRAAARDLPEARYARTDAESASLPILVEPFVVSNWKRPGSDEAHLPLQDIEQLRQFVHAGSAQQFSKPRNSRVVLDFENGPRDFI